MADLANIVKMISAQTNRAGLTDLIGVTGEVNVQEEEVRGLDQYANDLCKNYLSQTNHFAAMASEEEDTVVDMGEMGKDSKYIIAFDPLDGSRNVDLNMSIGTIFSVHKRLEGIDRDDEKQFLQKGRDQVLAGYAAYGPSTVLVFSFGRGVHEFTLDQDLGLFFLSKKDIKLSDECKYIGFNELYIDKVQPKDQKFIKWVRHEFQPRDRYVGSLVGDFHRILLKGGIFSYPGIDSKGEGVYMPKLRLNYEAKPMAFLIEQAGGMAVDGTAEINDIEPQKLHHRIPLIIGNRNLIEHYLKI